MICGSPLTIQGKTFPCGQCMNCRVNKKRAWIGRLHLEAAHSPVASSFVTLTYSDEFLPEDNSLDPRHFLSWIDRVRKRTGIGKVRYFGVGEYGDEKGRPHYHCVLYAVPPELWIERIATTWKLGFTSVAPVNKGTINYITGYTIKKMTSKDDERLDGRRPEFSRQSRKPPIGAAGFQHMLEMCRSKYGQMHMQLRQDAPHNYRINGRSYPIGQYWVNWLRENLGITNPPVHSDWELDYEAHAKLLAQAKKVGAKLWHEDIQKRKKSAL